MGATDECHSLASVDHWVNTGHDDQLLPAITEQQWPTDAKRQLAVAYSEQVSKVPGDGPVWRGKGWRVWYQNGACLDSRVWTWAALPDGIVLAVSYAGYRRWMAHGVDPYYCGIDGFAYDARNMLTIPGPTLPKQGVWVSDDEMRHFRWLAALAFII